MTMRVVFRADASVAMGTGHVMRCLTLADRLRARGAECRFVTRALPGHLGTTISDRGFAVSLLGSPTGPAPLGPPDHASWAGVSWEQDLAETSAVVTLADWLVVDHYAFDARWQRGLADRVAQIMVIDDLADRPHAAALLLDQNLGRDAQDYDSVLPETCQRLIGPRFALLRPEFAHGRAASLARRKDARLSHLMISMGGTDIADATSRVLQALAQTALPDDLRISVVMGSRAPALRRVYQLAIQMSRPTEVLVDVCDMAALMADADLAIGAGGSTTWERCCLGLPSIIVETAANQANTVVAMEEVGAALGTGPLSDPAFGERLVASVWQAASTLNELSACAAGLCNGQGASRVADTLLPRTLTVRPARLDDARDVWHWRNNGGATAFYLNVEPTPFANHLAWFEQALGAEQRNLLMVEADNIPMAHVRIDQMFEGSDQAEISISLNPEFHGKGLGVKVLSKTLASPQAKRFKRFHARVHIDNVSSIKVFTRMGFEWTSQDDRFLSLELSKPIPEIA